MRDWTRAFSRNVLLPALAAMVVSGCGRDLSDYRPVEKSTSRVTSERETIGSEEPDPGATAGAARADRPGDAVPDELPVSALGPVNVVDGTSVSTLLKVVPVVTELQEPVSALQPASATATAAAPEKPRTVQLLIPDKSFQRDAASKALRVSYDDLDLLKVLNLEPVTANAVELMPSWLKQLNGQRIRLRGFMYPTFEAEGIETFVLARDNQICCFGRDPKVYDLVQVDLRRGTTTDYIPATRAFDVIGRFKIEMASEDGKPYGLYYLEDAEIIDR